MVRQFAAAIVVIIHRRQIVVDERIRVNAFHRARQRHSVLVFPSAGFGCRQAQGWTNSFASREKGVTHRFVNGGRLAVSEGRKRSRARLTASVREAMNAFRSKEGAGLRRTVTDMRECCRKTTHL